METCLKKINHRCTNIPLLPLRKPEHLQIACWLIRYFQHIWFSCIIVQKMAEEKGAIFPFSGSFFLPPPPPPPPPPTSRKHEFYSLTSSFRRLILNTKYVCYGLISLHVNFHDNRTKWTVISNWKICRWGEKEKEPFFPPPAFF